MRAAITFLLMMISIMSQSENILYITSNGITREISLADTEAARQLKARVKEAPVEINLNDYGGFEKVGTLPWSLPTANRQLTTTSGDIMLYQGNNIVIFYGTNSWSYTPLGNLIDMSSQEIKNFLSGTNVKVTLSAEKQQSSLPDNYSDSDQTPEVYTLQGTKIAMTDRKLSDLPKGLYIINGAKQAIK